MEIRDKIDRVIGHRYTPYVTMIVILSIELMPLFFMYTTAFKPNSEIFRWPPTILPHHLTLGKFWSILTNSTIPTALRNSIIISLATCGIVAAVAPPTAWGLSRYPYRGSETISYGIIATRIIPPISLTVPFYMLFSKFGLNDTFSALIILNTFLNYPIVTWLLKNSFDDFPMELIDSARVDGAGRFETFRRIVFPVTKMTIAAGVIVTFLFTWNEFLYAMVFTQSTTVRPITVSIFQFVGDVTINWGKLCATGALATIPSMLFFLFAQKYIVKGLTAGAVKGAA